MKTKKVAIRAPPLSTSRVLVNGPGTCPALWAMPEVKPVTVRIPTGGGSVDVQLTPDVQPGSPLRAYEWTTYGLYNFGHLGWGLGRRRHVDGARPELIVAGLAPPGVGLRFDYFTPAGTATNDPTAISRIRITVRTDPETNTAVQSEAMVSNLFLRNN